MSQKKNEVALASQFSMDKVPAMLEQVNAQIKALKGDNEKTARITESLGIFGKVTDIKDPLRLIDAYAFITRKAAAFEEYAPVFQAIDPLTKIKGFTEAGHSLKAWQEEILNQYRAVTFQTKLDKLEKAKAILTENLSREQKFAASMNDIADIFDLEKVDAEAGE